MGHTFDNVRVHSDEKAMNSAASINALAYAAGNNIVFGKGQYSPGTTAGRRLLAHELTHVVQQSGNHNNVRIARQPAPPSAGPPPAPAGPAPSPLTLPREGVDMPWVGKGTRPSSELGYLRDPVFFWERFRTNFPAPLSPANLGRIAAGNAPIVDPQWISVYPQHAGYSGQPLEHHHVGQGSRAVPLPERLHDAYTVFHPQRRVVGTPGDGTKPLPPQPTRQQSQAEIDRHIRQGRITGPGVTPGSIPAPAIPPASELAAVNNPQRAGATRPPPGGGGRAVAAGAGGAILAMIAVPILNAYLQKHYAAQIEQASRDGIKKALEEAHPDLEATVQIGAPLIEVAHNIGERISLHVVVMQGWTDTADTDPIVGSGISIGRVPYVTKVKRIMLLWGNQQPPAYVPDRPGGLAGDIVREITGVTFRYHEFTFPIEKPAPAQTQIQASAPAP
jgi:hypothetical protein